MSDGATARPRQMTVLFRVLLVLGVALIVRFVAVYASRYASWTPAGYGDVFWPRRYGLALHLAGGLVAILTGPVQLWLGERRVAMVWHRRLGFTYLAGVTVGVAGGYYLALTSREVSWVYATGLAGLATAWALTTAMAYLAIRRRLISLHREWMIRSMVVTMAFVFFRLFDEVGARFGLPEGERSMAAAWMCWAVPLLVTEPILQWRRFRRPLRPAVGDGV